MKLFKILHLFWLLPYVVAKICASNSVIPFSGYKVTRRHKIRFRPLKSDSFLVLTKCHRGIPIFSRTVPTSTSQDEFSKSFRDVHTEFDFSDRWREEKSQNSGNARSHNQVAEKMADSFQRHKTKLKEWLRPIKQKSNKINNNNTDNELQETATSASLRIPRKHRRKKSRQISPPAPCLKMARRKRYARSNVVIFIPATFVGVLYSCNSMEMPENGRVNIETQALNKRVPASSTKVQGSSLKAIKPVTIQGFFRKHLADDTSLAGTSICPLVADDYSSHWLSVQLSPPALIYHVPYLRSPSVWDPRFRSAMVQEAPKWDVDVDINEEYVYTDSDLSRIGEALAASTKYLQRLFDVKRNKLTRLIAFKTRWLQKFDPRLQFSLILFSLGKPKALRHVVRLQRLWDSRFRSNATITS